MRSMDHARPTEPRGDEEGRVMPDSREEALRRRFDFDAWRGRNALREGLLIWKFALSGGEFDGWTARKIEASEAPPQAARGIEAGAPRGRQVLSFWSPGARGAAPAPEADPTAGPLVRVDVQELPSRQAAHEELIRVLGQFQSMRVARLDPPPCGDVAFGEPGEGLLVFARGNLVATLRNAGREVVPVTALGRELDGRLIARPAPGGMLAPAPLPLRPAAASTAPGAGVRLDVGGADEAAPREGAPTWYKIFAADAEVSIEGGHPVITPRTAGTKDVTAYGVGPAGEVSRGAATLEVRE